MKQTSVYTRKREKIEKTTRNSRKGEKQTRSSAVKEVP